MAKNSTIKTEILSAEQGDVKKHGNLKLFKSIAWLAVVIVVISIIGKNPQIVANIQNWFAKITNPVADDNIADNKLAEISVLKREIADLQNKLMILSNKRENVSVSDIEELKTRFVSMEKTNLGILESKADAATVLGIVTRLDKLEDKVDTLARVTDDSALILTAVLMVKDTAERGTIFAYEAEILRQLAQNNIKIKEPIALIEKIAAEGVKSDVYLVNSFNSIYKEVSVQQKKEFEKNWKDRINSKLNEFIQVRRTNQNVLEYEGNKSLNEIKKLVDEEDFSGALVLLNNVENKDWVEKYQSLKNWMKLVQDKLDFNAAIKQIANNSLAVMKVNSINKEVNND
ncbi:MAG: hypothetical protein IJX20_03670 [Alphaproteobacteria bacterium]|nr:hypothetical protein [Alphaproteobacteria bacterium]